MGDIDMTTTAAPVAKPALRPARPEFSSGPCAKRPGWSPDNLSSAVLGRSHRSKLGKARLKLAIDRTREVLEVPAFDQDLSAASRLEPVHNEAAITTLAITDLVFMLSCLSVLMV